MKIKTNKEKVKGIPRRSFRDYGYKGCGITLAPAIHDKIIDITDILDCSKSAILKAALFTLLEQYDKIKEIDRSGKVPAISFSVLVEEVNNV